MTRDEMIENLTRVSERLRGFPLTDARMVIGDVIAVLRAPAVTGEAHQTGPQPTACGGAAAMPISGPERPGESVKYPLDERGTPEDVTAGETALYTAPPAAGAPPAEGSPLPLEHTRSCGTLTGRDCTCGLAWRIRLATEQEMHAAWRKRANEAEARENAGAPPALVALVQELRKAQRAYMAVRSTPGAEREARGKDVDTAAKAVDVYLDALGSPAPAPVAPPALSVEDAHAAKSITPAPPAVAGGDAPAIQPTDLCEMRDGSYQNGWYAMHHKDQVMSITRQAAVIWRRRQEGQAQP